MGTELENRNSGTNEGVKRSFNTENTGSRSGSDNGNRTSATAGAGNTNAGNDSTGNTGSGNNGGKAEEKKLSGVALVSSPETAPLPEAPKKKTRRKQTSKKKQKDQPTVFDSSQITALLVSVSTVIASRPHLHMFALSEMEAEQIATPLSNMLTKSEKLSAVSEHADAIALVSACLIIMLPRVIMYFDEVKRKKLEANGGVRIVDNRNHKKTESTTDNREAVGAPSAVKPTDANGIFASIPSII